MVIIAICLSCRGRENEEQGGKPIYKKDNGLVMDSKGRYGPLLYAYKDFSPLHNIKHGTPPMIFLQGDSNKHTPVATAKLYKSRMGRVGSRCDLHMYKGKKHDWF